MKQQSKLAIANGEGNNVRYQQASCCQSGIGLSRHRHSRHSR